MGAEEKTMKQSTETTNKKIRVTKQAIESKERMVEQLIERSGKKMNE